MTGYKLPHCLIKVTDQKIFSDALVEKGDLFISALEKFSKYDDDGKTRNDILEGASHLLQVEKLKEDKIPVLAKGIDGHYFDISEHMVGNFIRRDIDNKEYKIYSTYAFNPSEPEIDDRMFEFGEYLTIIFDVPKFLKKIDERVSELNKDRNDWEKVKFYFRESVYVDPNEYHGTWSNFLKPADYKYQNEFRIIFHDPLLEIKSNFLVGDISDLSASYYYKDIIE
ncbi:hypothetical protein AB1K89_06985 [Sporosarcina sp. 179-K 8C2 HS]|uniref:hypothetical protein n=1 Tax=Sporosarcina sp. 179-K 8C2 HS TaxID=3142387 RepID=UPI0039A10C6C